MKVRIQKWGNSLAIRMPRTICQQLNLDETSVVELTVENAKICVAPSMNRLTLEEMVALITPENQHGLVFPDNL